jgi:hypothetical protein
MSLEHLIVQLTNEHLEKLLKTKAIRALEELIWNALDADADIIDIIFERNDLDGIESIIVTDNGHGINYDSIDHFFGSLGNSHKAGSRFSPQGRKYHGKNGEGRYRSFALGTNVQWTTISQQKEGRYKTFEITGRYPNLKLFSVSRLEESINSNTGVTVKITNLKHKNTDQLSNIASLIQQLTAIFAPYLLVNKNIKIFVDGIQLNVHNFIKDSNEQEVAEILESGDIITGKIKIIEWISGNIKNTFLSDSSEERYYEEEPSGLKAGAFPHTVFISSSLFEELTDNQIQVREFNEGYKRLKEISIDILRKMYRERLANDASNEIKLIKKMNIYPYTGTPKNALEKATRQVFDIFAVKINELIPELSRTANNSKQFTYRLLKEALESNPSSLQRILQEVLELSTEQQDELASLLNETSLDSIINTTTLISNRIKFLYGLEEVLYENTFHRRLKERSQLHKILLNELWLFGEKYAYSHDDISLKNVLKKHIKKLGRDELLDEINFSEIKGLNDIPDIGLHKQCVLGDPDHLENLIIELKRPSCTIGEKEISQIKNYAYAVEENEYFDKEKTKWKFILLGVKLDNYAIREMNQQGRVRGNIYRSDDGNIEVWVKEWNQVINDAKGKYRYLQEKLELQVKDNNSGIEYLRAKYNEYLPD